MSNHGRRKRRKSKSKLKIFFSLFLTLIILAILLMVVAVLIGYNPFLERQLHAQFGSEFFSDFGEIAPPAGEKNIGDIIGSYENSFQNLEDKALERLEDLFLAAMEEYEKQDRSGTLDRFMLTNKYIQAGRLLEKNVDVHFYDLLYEMEEELIANGYSLVIVDDIEQSYKKAKTAKMAELLKRLRSQISS